MFSFLAMEHRTGDPAFDALRQRVAYFIKSPLLA
jgi:hypothetical protein